MENSDVYTFHIKRLCKTVNYKHVLTISFLTHLLYF